MSSWYLFMNKIVYVPDPSCDLRDKRHDVLEILGCQGIRRDFRGFGVSDSRDLEFSGSSVYLMARPAVSVQIAPVLH